MDAFNFCWLTLLDESKKSSVFFDKNTCNVRNDIDENFNKPVNRIAYLYKFGSYNICFFHQCFYEFFAKAPDSTKIIDNIRSLKNPNICSMSVGPGTDIVGLLYSLYLVNKPLKNSAAFKFISRHGSWRNLVNEMMSSSFISVPDASTCKLLECDFLKEMSKKAKGYLKTADIVLMCNSFSSSISPGKMICNTVERIHLLKPGALVFFIVSEEKSAYLKQLDCFGSFLYGPVEITLKDMPYNEKIAELVGVKPLCSGTSLFAVWQKTHEVNSEIKLQKTENSLTVDSNQQSSAKLANNKSDVKDVKSQILSMPILKRESSDSNISSRESIASSSQLSASSVSNQILKREGKEHVSDSPLSFIGQKIEFSGGKINFANNISPVSVNTTDSLLRKKYAPLCGSGSKKKENNDKNMDSLLKNFESLITKLEGMISSQDSSHNYVQEKQYSSDQQCHQNMQQDHCGCSVKPCQIKGNGSACCHSMMCYNTNRNCSAGVASNLCRTLPQEGPYIVIPLQNLSNESLTHIMSIVSQNCSSTNEST